MKTIHVHSSVAICLLLFLLAACATTSPPVRFYALTQIADPAGVPPSATREIAVRVMPVDVPDALDRPEIVTYQGRNSVQLGEFDRWAGRLGDSIGEVLAENLSQLLGTDLVAYDPVIDVDGADYVVAMSILRLEPRLGEQVVFKTQWRISPDQPDTPATTRVSSVNVPLQSGGYEAVAAGVSQALEQVSREIAGTIIDMGQNPAQTPELRPEDMPRKK